MSRVDPFHNLMQRFPQPLDPIFYPKNICVVGAKDDAGSVGRTIMYNLIHSEFSGHVYPVNPKRDEVMGLVCYPSLDALPEPVDLCVIVTPSRTVPAVMEQACAAKVRGAIVISAGFKELGAEGEALEQQVMEIAHRGGIRVIGPNCLGVMNPLVGLNATFAKGMALPGNIAFISQSGAMCTAVLDWSLQEGIGFSSFVSIGSMSDVDWGDLILYLGGDSKTETILLYMETVGNPRSFLTAAREVALQKPIIVIKGGKTQESAQAAASHTGSLAGSDAVFEAALERCGVLRAHSIGELFDLAQSLAFQPRPKGNRLGILTNAGGPGVLATDAVILGGAKMATLSTTAYTQLNTLLPSHWSHSNPVDLLGDASSHRYVKATQIMLNDSMNDGVLVILTPQDMTDPTQTAIELTQMQTHGKPLITSWMGGSSVQEAVQQLTHAKIPCFPYPDQAARTFAKMWDYQENLARIYQTPSLTNCEEDQEHYSEWKQQTQTFFDTADAQGRLLLTEAESKELLRLWKLPVDEIAVVFDAEEAVEVAQRLGYPVVCKIVSKTITHKKDVGGVWLNLETEYQVREAYDKIAAIPGAEAVSVQRMVDCKGFELIMGSYADPQFGPILLFGTGGSLVEVYQDTALALPPLNSSLAQMMCEKTKIYQALQGVRGDKAVNIEALVEVLVRFSDMILMNPRIRECDINPLFITQEGLIAVDARVVLYPKEETPIQAAIRPYPVQYAYDEELSNGVCVHMRPIRPHDEPLLAEFHENLSESSVKNRFLEFVNLEDRVTRLRLTRICSADYDRDFALVTLFEGRIVGVGRLSKVKGSRKGHMKLVVMDAMQNMGLGKKILERLLEIAKNEGFQALVAKALHENKRMIRILEQYGFAKVSDDADGLVYEKDILSFVVENKIFIK